jgi:signal transduction histidine kinase
VQPIDRIDDPVKLRRLVKAMVILDGEQSLPVILRRVVEEARDLVEAEYGALGVLNQEGTGLDQFLTVGLAFEEEAAIGPRPTGQGVLGTLIADPRPLRLSNLAESPESFGFPEHHPRMASFLGVPVRVRGEVYGNLYLTDKRNGESFTEEDEATVLVLALSAGTAIENARLHTVMRERALTEDRDRIARDLHDSIIQRLFAIGLSLQGTARLSGNPEVTGRISDAINKLDETIRQLRTAIFDLELTIKQDGFERSVYDLLHDMTPVVGMHPQVTLSGNVNATIPQPIADQALAVLRESITNVGKHAGATQVVVRITIDTELRIVVVDDGHGIAANAPEGLGLKNMRQRAEQLGGTLELGRSREGGTRLSWTVPLHSTVEESQGVTTQ